MAIFACVHTVGIHATGKGFATFADFFCQAALHQAKPVLIHQGFVFTVYGCYRVFTVHDGRQSRFHDDVFDASRVLGADGAGFVDDHIEMQAIV